MDTHSKESQSNSSDRTSVATGSAEPSTTDAGQSTASVPHLSDHIKKVLELKFPRCCVCGIGWFSYNEDDDHKNPSTIGSSRSTTSVRTSHTQLYPQPQCKCFTRMAIFDSGIKSIIDNDEFHSVQDVLSAINIHSFPYLATCKTCLENRTKASREVEKYDYQQDGVENGQRSIMYSLSLKCTSCSVKFMERKYNLEKLEDQGRQIVVGAKKGVQQKFNWFDSVDSTIKFIGWMKRQKRKAKRDARRARKAGEGENRDIRMNWWTEVDNCDSDACYSFSSDSESDLDDRKSSYPRRQIAAKGEVKQFYEQELAKEVARRQKEVEADAEFARQLSRSGDTISIEELKKKEDIEKKDYELAQKLQNEMETADKSRQTPTHKRKAQKQSIKTLFSKQSKTGESIPLSHTIEAEEQENVGLATLIEMGYDIQIAKQCLLDAKGDVALAASMLVSQASSKVNGEVN